MKKEVIAVDIGGTNTRVALVKNNKINSIFSYDTPKNNKEFLSKLFYHIKTMNGENITGIGIACPGPLKNGVVFNPPNISLKNYNLKSEVEKRFKIETRVENDAKCSAIAEHRFGCKKDNFILITLGTGIGGAVFIDGKLLNENNFGTELGYIYFGEKTFEESASNLAVRKLSKKYLGKELDFSEIAKKTSPKAVKIYDIIVENISKGIGSLINIFDPKAVILSGGMTNDLKLIKEIRKRVKKYILLPLSYDIRKSSLKYPGIVGASLLFDNYRELH